MSREARGLRGVDRDSDREGDEGEESDDGGKDAHVGDLVSGRAQALVSDRTAREESGSKGLTKTLETIKYFECGSMGERMGEVACAGGQYPPYRLSMRSIVGRISKPSRNLQWAFYVLS